MGSLLAHFEPVILVIHFIVALFLVAVILLQAGKGTDIGSMFGAGSSQSLFGARGAGNLLTKLTTITALLFLATSLGLATISNYAATGAGSDSVIEQEDSQAAGDPAAQDAAPEAAREEQTQK